jgi:hypothetical protein
VVLDVILVAAWKRPSRVQARHGQELRPGTSALAVTGASATPPPALRGGSRTTGHD